jgi:vacuolar-type H+-ATPase subunit H
MIEGASDRSVERRASIGPIGGFLERFRRSTGVPAAVGDEASVELAPVFAVLDEIEQEAATIRARSEQVAARLLHEAREDATAIVADARSKADAERGDALKAGLRAADAAAAAIIADAEHDALRIERTGAAKIPAFVGRVQEGVLGAEP